MKKPSFRLIALLVGILILCCSINSTAAPQLVWIVKTLNNIRRATVAASNAAKAGKVIAAVGKCAHALPDEEIDDLARIAAKPNGLHEVGQILGAVNYYEKYGDDAAELILQDTYLRIAIKNGKISPSMANDVMKGLAETPGLRSLLVKINSSSYSQAKGHMRELEIALQAQKRGFQPVSLGQKFADGIKHADTDLDVLIRRGSKNFAIESKAYAGFVPDDMVKADAESLLVFCKEIGQTTPVFCFESEPSILAREFLKNRGIKCLVGTAEEIAAKLDILSAIK